MGCPSKRCERTETGEGCAPPANQSGKNAPYRPGKSAPTLSRNLPHAGEINDPRIGAAAADDELRAFFFCNLLQFVVVDGFQLLWSRRTE